jgi:hypothetical protein
VPPIECSRTLLFPGPQPPLSHFGATLLRHALATGLRYSFHNLGLNMPERPPVRIVRLRVYLDPGKLLDQLEPGEISEEIVAALVDPAGSGDLPSGRLRGALSFHRARLRLRSTPRLRSGPAAEPDASPAELWTAFRTEISRLQTTLNDALLAELAASLARRAARQAGKRVEPCLGPQAHRLRASKRCDLASLGVPDLMTPGWEHSPAAKELVLERLAGLAPPAAHRSRGGFREIYRRALSIAREPYLRLAQSARDRGLIETPGDAFFIPFDLAEDLTSETRPGWLGSAVASNRMEYQNLVEAGGPPELIRAGESKNVVEDRESWPLGPVWPLE